MHYLYKPNKFFPDRHVFENHARFAFYLTYKLSVTNKIWQKDFNVNFLSTILNKMSSRGCKLFRNNDILRVICQNYEFNIICIINFWKEEKYLWFLINYVLFFFIYIYYIYIYNHENNVPTVHHVPKSMSCHKAIAVITGRAYCFHDYIYYAYYAFVRFEHSMCRGSLMTT